MAQNVPPVDARGRVELGAAFAGRDGLSATASVFADGLGVSGDRARGARLRLDWAF